ncbi:Rad52/Rad22 family DNA repair protein [Viridibacillus arvi]|uniref:Rad52/Rad22 family DNA repair protein n=1 Tax=Viridibacillus arvi TaxID=263475 RepID=UPI003D267346
MNNGNNILNDLARPFKENEIEWRVQSVTSFNNNKSLKALVVPYISARTVMNRLDDVCGTNWKTEYENIIINGVQAFQCSLSIFVEGQWITQTDGAEVTDISSVKGKWNDKIYRVSENTLVVGMDIAKYINVYRGRLVQ